jgi:hypothetical protein
MDGIRTTSKLGLAIAGALILLAVGPLAVAQAQPVLAITAPASESVTGSASVTIAGTTTDVTDPVTVRVTGTHHEIIFQVEATLAGEAWSVNVELPDETYEAVAEQDEQAEPLAPPVRTEPQSFSVKTKAPAVSLFSPAVSHESVVFGGQAGNGPGDDPEVVIDVYEEGVAKAIQEVHAVRQEGEWHSESLGLPSGNYIAQASQGDAAGHIGPSAGFSALRAFTIKPNNAPAVTLETPGFATQDGTLVTSSATPSFSATPLAGISSVKLSIYAGTSAAGSPLQEVSMTPSGEVWSASLGQPLTDGIYTAQAEDAAPAGKAFSQPVIFSVELPVAPVATAPLEPAAPTATTVTNTVTNTVLVPVVTPALTLMQPFPIVRIAGAETSYGAQIKLLTVQAPPGSKVTITCKGSGCKTKSESRIATAASKGKSGTLMLSFPRFERALRVGAVLQIRVSKVGEIGKFTSFTIRRHKLPVRTDACLNPTGQAPIACPTA